jgi:hypothetical protein
VPRTSSSKDAKEEEQEMWVVSAPHVLHIAQVPKNGCLLGKRIYTADLRSVDLSEGNFFQAQFPKVLSPLPIDAPHALSCDVVAQDGIYLVSPALCALR